MKVAVALAFAIIFASFGDVLLSIGMKRTGGVTLNGLSDFLPAVRTAFSSPFVLLGVSSMAFHFASYIAALAWVDVSVVNPMTALSYLIVSIYATLFLKEHIDFQRGAGIVLIMTGAVLVGLSS